MTRPPFARALPSHGLIAARGAEFPELLNRLSTQALVALHEGEARETLLVTEKARVIDAVLAAAVTHDETLLLVSPGRAARIVAWLEKYTIMEDVVYSDISSAYRQFEITPAADGTLPAGIGETAPNLGYCAAHPALSGALWLRHASVQAPGLRLLLPADGAEATARALYEGAGLAEADEADFEQWRIQHGYPSWNGELDETAHPFESGAAAAVSLTKGCYIGQEVIARLDSYGKVQRLLCRVLLDAGAATPRAGDRLTASGADAGYLTSVAPEAVAEGLYALARVRVAHVDAGTALAVESGAATIPATVLGPAPSMEVVP